MPVPSVSIQKQVGQTGSVGPSPVGVLAIIAPSPSGPVNVPSGYSSDGQAFNDFGPSPLAEDFSYDLAVSGNQGVLVRPTTATAASYGTIDLTRWTGTSTPTAGVTAPSDWYDVIVTAGQTGAVGSAGLTYTFSLDGGITTSAPQPIPTGTAPITIALPNFARGGSPGVSFSLSAGNINAGDFFRVNTKSAMMTDADLATSLEALRTTTLPWEAVLIDMEADASTIGLIDTWLAGLEKVGKFKMAFVNTRFKSQLHLGGTNSAETESAFATAMTTLVQSQAPSIRMFQGTDGGAITSTLTGVTQPRHAAVFVAARCMEIPIGEEPAYVGRGALNGVRIVDPNTPGAPLFHNEEIYPNLDQLLLGTLRSVAGQAGAFVTNGLIFSTVGSDFALIPHVRTMNRAAEITYQVLLTQLSRGVGKKPKDPVTGLVYIQEADARVIEGLVNSALSTPLKNQVQNFLFSLSRTDDLSSQSGATVNSTLQLVSLAYIKQFKVIASFTKSLAVAA